MSVSLAVDKTGNVITTAGLIMCVSFAGLLIPPTTVLNQYGFSLFIGVAIDTFIVRTLLVPALLTAFEAFSLWLKIKQCDMFPSIFRAGNVNAQIVSNGDLEMYSSPSLDEDSKVDDDHFLQLNWWPMRMPPTLLTRSEEHEAVSLGFYNPQQFLEYKKTAPLVGEQ
jgi:hypothetical protein